MPALPQQVVASEAGLEITVSSYDYAGVQPVAVARAERIASLALGTTGVAVRWQNCALPGSGLRADSPCAQGVDDVTHLVLAILPEPMAQRIAPSQRQFGLAVLGREGGCPTQVYVFLGRIRDLARGEALPWEELLGAMIAHEVGHLMLGNNGHAPEGIMRANWRRAEIKQALIGALGFTSQQAERMRADVRRRLQAAQARP